MYLWRDRWHVWNDSFICVTWLIYVRHDSFMRDMEHSHCYCAGAFQTCLIQICATTCLDVWVDAFTYVTWRIHMWHDSFIRHYGVATVSRIEKIIGLFCRILSLLQVAFAKETYNFIDPTNWSYRISFVTWLVHTNAMTRSHQYHDSFTPMPCRRMSSMNHSNFWHDSFVHITNWG